MSPDVINVIDWKPYGPSYGALASFLSTGIKQDGELVGVFCTQLPPESRPVEVSEMQPILETAVQSIETAANYYLAGPSNRIVVSNLSEVKGRAARNWTRSHGST